MIQKQKKKIIMGIAVLILVAAGCLVSRGVEVEISTGKVYEKQELTKDDLTVTSCSLFGIRRTVKSYHFTQDDESVTVTYQLTKKKLNFNVIVLEELQASYTETIYQWSKPNQDAIKVVAAFEDGTSKEVNEISCSLPEEITEKTEVTVECLYGETDLLLEPVMVEALQADFNGTVYAGETIKEKEISLTLQYTDGNQTNVDDFICDTSASIDTTTELPVTSRYGDTACLVEPIAINWIELDSEQGAYEQDTLADIALVFHYEDGTEKNISSDQVTFSDDTSRELVYGENTFDFSYAGNTYTLTVNAKHTTKVIRAKRKGKEELANADETHVTDNIYVTVTKYQTSVSTYFLSHVVINYPEQIHSGLSNDTYGGERETPSSASKRLDWVIGTNGSNFNYSNGKPTYANVKIKNSEIMDDSENASNAMEICLTKDGELYSPKTGTTAQNLLANGVTDTWCCGDSLLVSEGERAFDCSLVTARYPRTAVGMVEPCEYYLITAGSGNFQGGMTYQEIQDLFMDLGCEFGKCMDGGGSSALVFENRVLNNPADGKERPVVDFLYFTDIVTYG